MTAASIEQLGWMLVHSIWQLAALALVLMLLLRLLAQASARARYNCAAFALLLMTAALPLTYLFVVPPSGGMRPPSQQLVVPLSGGIRSPSQQLIFLPSSGGLIGRNGARIPPEGGTTNVAALWLVSCDQLAARIGPWLGTLVACWLAGIALLSLRPLIGWRAVRHLRTNGVSPAPPEIGSLACSAAHQLGIPRTFQVLQSSLVQVPAVVGWLHPIVLLPIGIAHGLTPAQLSSILAHELAHIRRQDCLMNLLQTLAETLLFYHPAAWWVSHQMRLERENCCDDMALALGADRRQYARALLALAELDAVPSPALAASGGALLARIRRILQAAPAGSAQPGGVAGIFLALLLPLALLVAMNPSASIHAEDQPEAVQRRPRESQPDRVPSRAKPARNAERTAAADAPWVSGVAADPWFWPDPYSHLGHDDAAGEGWSYVRIAADRVAGQDLGTTDQQRAEINNILREFSIRQRDLGRKLAQQDRVDAAAWSARRREVWLPARDAARALLTDQQHRRVEQLMIQRQSYNAFRNQELIKQLELSAEQHRKILAAIENHLERIRGEEAELKDITKRASAAPENRQLAEQLAQMTTGKARRGRLSHRRVWDEIGKILTPTQRQQFNALRGPMPDHVRDVLHHFEAQP